MKSVFQLISKEQAPEVLLQLAIAAPKLGTDPIPMLLAILAKSDSDPSGLLPRICWRNLEPHLDGKVGALVQQLQSTKIPAGVLKEILPRVLDRCVAKQKEQPDDLMQMLGYLLNSNDRDLTATALAAVVRAELDGELPPNLGKTLRFVYGSALSAITKAADPKDPRTAPAVALTIAGTPNAATAWKVLTTEIAKGPHRSLLVRASAKAMPDGAIAEIGNLLKTPNIEAGFARELLSIISRHDRPEVSELLLSVWKTLPPEAAPQVLDALSSRPAWAHKLVDAVTGKQIPTAAVNVNQIRRMQEFGDKKLAERVAAVWGQIRSGRNPDREKIVADHMRLFRNGVRGNIASGAKVYEKHCAQCHQFRGKGVEVGPKLDENGRTGVPLLVSNILDPSLVIGKDYQARLLLMADGRSLTGLVVEDSPTRVVLKVAGDKREVAPKDQIEKMKMSDVSLMPEQLEKQMTPQEFRDLVAFLMQPG